MVHDYDQYGGRRRQFDEAHDWFMEQELDKSPFKSYFEMI